MVYAKYDEVIGKAIERLAPAELAFEQGLAGVAVNRRRSRGAESRKLGGQVDQDVPVITVKNGNDLKAIVFGYSCHTTALGGGRDAGRGDERQGSDLHEIDLRFWRRILTDVAP